MNRKLRNTILAFSVTGTVLAVGLFAARPAATDPVAARALAAASPACMPAAGQDDLVAAQPAVSADAGGAALVAGAAAAVLAGLESAEAAEADVEGRRRSRHVRRAVAVPYFSFARGAGRDSRS